MSTIEKTIDVDVPIRKAYNQWAHFETFPRFMEGVEEVQQVSPTRTHWRTQIAGVEREFDAELIDAQPDRRIEWRSINGPKQAGIVTFAPVSPQTTRIALRMDFEPEGLIEKIGDSTNIIEARVEGDLERFKEFVESPHDRADRPFAPDAGL